MMKLVNLSEVARIDWGNTSLTKKSYQSEGDFLGVSAAGCDGRMSQAEQSVGTLVLSAIGANCGKMFYPDEPFTAIKNTIVIEPNSDIDSKYLFYFLNTNQILSRGAGQPFITKGDTSKKKIPLPPLEEQKKIAAILDAADDYRQKTKALIDKYDQLTQSLFLDMFGDPVTNPKGWDYCKLSDIADYFIGLTYKPGNVQKEGIIVLRSSNVQNSKLSFKDIVRVDTNVKDKLLVKTNDILMCTRNGSSRLVGKVALIGNEKEEMTFGAFMTIIRSDNYSYLMNFFKTTGFRRQILTGATTTVNQITKSMLNRVELQLPPIELQNQFAERVAQIEKQKQQAEASLVKAEELFSSLLQRAFKGELTS